MLVKINRYNIKKIEKLRYISRDGITTELSIDREVHPHMIGDSNSPSLTREQRKESLTGRVNEFRQLLLALQEMSGQIEIEIDFEES